MYTVYYSLYTSVKFCDQVEVFDFFRPPLN